MELARPPARLVIGSIVLVAASQTTDTAQICSAVFVFATERSQTSQPPSKSAPSAAYRYLGLLQAQANDSPYVILNDFGGAFAMGAIGGGIWHGIKGARNSPKGERLAGSLSAIKARAPVLGGNFGVWGGLFSTFDCAVKGYRQKEDPWNAIISGFMTGGTLALRSGPKSAFGSAVGCGILLGVFEGVGVLMGRMFAQPVPAMQLPEQAPAAPAVA